VFYARNANGSYDPFLGRYFTIGALEQDYPHDANTYLEAGEQSFEEHKHFWWNNGYLELNYGLYPVRPHDVFDGPFRVPRSSPAPLVVATTYDPATPYDGALNLVRDLGNARLLTMSGDGHTAYGGNSACIDAAVDAYIDDSMLPPSGTLCPQDIGFPAPQLRSEPLTAAGANRRPSATHSGSPPL
jgi:hypothetical protein